MVAPTVEEEDRTPFAAVEPTPPCLTFPGTSSKNPPEKDHIFCDMLGTIESGLEQVFGKIDLVERMRAYDPRLVTIFEEMKRMDLGHSNDTFTILRVYEDKEEKKDTENDQQAYQFGRYSEVFLWRLCRCVSANFIDKKEVRIILHQEAPTAWQRNVFDAYANLMKSLVDKDALKLFLQGRSSRSVKLEKFTHSVLSRKDALALLDGLVQDAPSEKIRTVLENHQMLKQKLADILEIISPSENRLYQWDNRQQKHVWKKG